MADEHNPNRYGETWPQYKIDAYLEAMLPFQSLVVFSGGWAWHFMSPKDHPEYKHAHDHKDVDWMVPKGNVGTVVGMLKNMGFDKVRTRFDHLPSAEDFRRYEKVVPYWACRNCSWTGSEPESFDYGDGGDIDTYCPHCEADCKNVGFRLTIDFFVRDVPIRTIDGWMVVEPSTLLTFYSTFHSSKSCFAVQAAKKLIDAGQDPVGHPSLVEIPTR